MATRSSEVAFALLGVYGVNPETNRLHSLFLPRLVCVPRSGSGCQRGGFRV
jgi:hypothetical protein